MKGCQLEASQEAPASTASAVPTHHEGRQKEGSLERDSSPEIARGKRQEYVKIIQDQLLQAKYLSREAWLRPVTLLVAKTYPQHFLASNGTRFTK